MVNWRTLLPEQNEIKVGKSRKNKRPTKIRADEIRTKLRGFAKLSGKLGASTLKASANKSTSVEESLRRFFELTMHLRSPQEIHLRLTLSGKPNWVPQRFLTHPPKQKTGSLNNANKKTTKHHTKSTFDKAAEKVAGAFGDDNSARHEKMRSLLQIFSYYSDLGPDGIRTHGYSNFIKLIDNCQLVRFTEYKTSNELLCWKVFAKMHANISDPMSVKLNFEQFVDGFPELVPFVFRTSSRPPQELAKELINKHIITRASRVRSDPLTLALLWNEKAQAVITKFHWQLQVIFKHFADLYDDAAAAPSNSNSTGSKDNATRHPEQATAEAEIGGTQTTQDIKEWMRTPGSEDTIDWQEFYKLLECFGIVGNGIKYLSQERARVMFDEANLSEIADADVDRLCWHEYVEALGRCALEMYPLQDESVSKRFGVTKAEVTFNQVTRKLTTGVKSAVESAFRNGPTAKPPQKGKTVIRRLSPRARLFQDKGWIKPTRQPKIGMVKWGRDKFVGKTDTFGKVLLVAGLILEKENNVILKAQLPKIKRVHLDRKKYLEIMHRIDRHVKIKMLKVSKVFSQFDTSGDGSLDLKEFRSGVLALMQDASFAISKQEIIGVFNAIDVDNSKSMSFHEFQTELRNSDPVRQAQLIARQQEGTPILMAQQAATRAAHKKAKFNIAKKKD